PIREASSFGVVGVDSSHRVIEFQEKPARPKSLPYDQRRALVSMGVYVFNAEALSDMLRRDHENPNSTHDFGTDVLPRMLTEAPVYAYQFGGAAGRVSVDRYWRDVGTIDSFYQANMELLHARPPMNLYQKDWPIRTFERRSPPARTAPGPNGSDAQLFNSILSSGVVVSGGIVRNSVLSPHVRVDEGAVVIDSVLFDDVRIGEGARVKNCIIDKGVYVPPGTNIGFDRYEDQQRFTVSENGVTVVPKDYRFDSEFDESAEPPKLSLNRQVG
ncbi:MAG: glucose-1-phosphate adenylyltransferase, partial [Planctomycetales bacterium]|nr:glucose-1-phosphate adenylyltransferase [Planctomycetales bacterium]